MGRRFPSALAIAVGAASVCPLYAQIAASDRTADMPDSWLVLYNSDSASGSPAWKDWYTAEWGVPAENTFGLQVPTDERITSEQFQNEIFYPVQAHLNAHPELKSRIMGILVGYRVPGNFYADDTHPPSQGGGGWSVSNNLADMVYATWYKRGNPHVFQAHAKPSPPRLTKATLTADCYLTARLDGPDLDSVQTITQRARTLSASNLCLPSGESLYYDYLDIGAPAGDEWPALRATVQSPYTNTPTWTFPWLAYESETEPMPRCAAHFSYYRVTGWETIPWLEASPGSRIVALAMNSWGATTVRSTTDQGGRFVPNAVFNGGFAGAIGATAEPYTGSEPFPGTIVSCLAEGRTMGEAFFHANPYRNFMWELVGDPLLRVPYWFADPTVPLPAPADLGPLEAVSGAKITDTTPTVSFVLALRSPGVSLSYQVQIDDDSEFAAPEVDFTSGPLLQFGVAAFTVGQPAGDGTYAAGAEGMPLPLGAYHWRVRSIDQMGTSEWASPGNSGADFQVIAPLWLVGAASRKTHGTAGDLDVPLPLDPSPGQAAVECRKDGPTMVILTFSREVMAVDGTPDETEVALSAGTLGPVTVSGSQMTVNLSGAADMSCLVIAISGITDLAGNPLTGDNDVHIRVLLGDTNGSGAVSVADVNQTRSRSGQTADAGNYRSDTNCTGSISVADVNQVRSRSGNAVPCP